MKTYKIAVSWEMYGYVKIKAESLEEAIKKAEDDETPLPDGNYIDGSFLVDEQMTEEFNKEVL